MKSKALKTAALPPTRVREDTLSKLRAEAERRETSVSALIREAVVNFLSKIK